MSGSARRIGRAMLDMLDSMADGSEWTARDLQDEIGVGYSLSDKLLNMEARGFVEVTREWTAPTGSVWRWYRITASGRDALALEVRMGRVPGVD